MSAIGLPSSITMFICSAAMPALVVVLLGWWRGWDPLLSSDIAMWATLTNLLAWQVALLAPQRRSNAALLLTLG